MATNKKANSEPTNSHKLAVLISVIAIVFAVGILTGFVLGDRVYSPNDSAEVAQETSDLTYINFQGQDGRNVLELLKESYEVQTITVEGQGEVVTSIEGVASDASNSWNFYVNEELGVGSSSAYVTKSADAIVWNLEPKASTE